MLKIEENPLLSWDAIENDDVLTQEIAAAFAEVESSLSEELRECAKLQVESEAFAMSVAGDSIY